MQWSGTQLLVLLSQPVSEARQTAAARDHSLSIDTN
jgi:hypothetical protein